MAATEQARYIMIEECEFIQRMGNTVKMKLKEADGKFKTHYHRYKTEEKAIFMYHIYAGEIKRNGGCVC